MWCRCHALRPFCPGLQVHAFWNIFFSRSDAQWSFSVTSAWPWNQPSAFRRCRALCNCWYPGAHECMRTCVQHCATIVVLVHFLASSTHFGLSNFEFPLHQWLWLRCPHVDAYLRPVLFCKPCSFAPSPLPLPTYAALEPTWCITVVLIFASPVLQWITKAQAPTWCAYLRPVFCCFVAFRFRFDPSFRSSARCFPSRPPGYPIFPPPA